jgi:hypothetical protein
VCRRFRAARPGTGAGARRRLLGTAPMQPPLEPSTQPRGRLGPRAPARRTACAEQVRFTRAHRKTPTRTHARSQTHTRTHTNSARSNPHNCGGKAQQACAHSLRNGHSLLTVTQFLLPNFTNTIDGGPAVRSGGVAATACSASAWPGAVPSARPAKDACKGPKTAGASSPPCRSQCHVMTSPRVG